MFENRFENIISAPRERDFEHRALLGESREGRDIYGYKSGGGSKKISLIAGCHADEPVGPKLLRHLVSYLEGVSQNDSMLRDFQWWIVPHVNPDGELRNQKWQREEESYHLLDYLRYVVREAPGDDVEFGFPRGPDDSGARAENLDLANWWGECSRSFSLHCSLHGMGFAAGPWFLIEPDWVDRCQPSISP
jgi:murein tripeptide amidase MpaA